MRKAAFAGCTPVATAVLLTAANAFAQDTTVGVGATTAVPPRQVAAAAPVAGVPAINEHEMWVGHLGVGWLGTKDVLVGPVSAANPVLSTPVVGVRYWLTSMIGIDAGLGFYTTSSSSTTTMTNSSVTTDLPSRTAFVIHGGVPIALADAGHFSFQITPELDVGFGSGTIRSMMPAGNIDLSGFLLQAGARAGAEIHFGFIGIPQLALEGSVGAYLRTTSGKQTQGPNSSKISTLTIATSSITQPWDFFTSNLAARYYF